MGAVSAPALPTAAAHPDPVIEAARAATSDALVRVARLLDGVAEDQARSSREVRVGWQGLHRHRFDAERAGRDAELAGLAATCRLLAGR